MTVQYPTVCAMFYHQWMLSLPLIICHHKKFCNKQLVICPCIGQFCCYKTKQNKTPQCLLHFVTLTTTKLPLLLMPMLWLVATGPLLLHVSSFQDPGWRNILIWDKPCSWQRKRARELVETCTSTWGFCSSWPTSLPLLFHWPKQVSSHAWHWGREVQSLTAMCWKSHGDGWRCIGKGEQIIENSDAIYPLQSSIRISLVFMPRSKIDRPQFNLIK